MNEMSLPGTLPRVLRNAPLDPKDDGNYVDFSDPGVVVSALKDANVITSALIGSDLHAPVIDLDLPVTLLPSSTKDHYHLYIDKPMTRRQMLKLLKTMRDVGIVEEGFYRAARKRGAAAVRLPWIRKQR